MSDFIKELCNNKHLNIDKEIKEVKGVLSEHDKKIDQLQESNVKLTQILEMLTKQDNKFWNSALGQKIVTWVFWLFAIVILLGIGGQQFIPLFVK